MVGDSSAAAPRMATSRVGEGSPGGLMAGQTVVLVDDNEALLEGMREILAQHALEVIAFRQFESAREYLQTHSPSALVTDVRLGAFNGLHLVLLAKQWTPEIAAFVYSAYSDTAIRTEAS